MTFIISTGSDVWSGVDAAQAESVTVKAGATTFAFKKAGANWVDDAKPTEPINTTRVTELLTTFVGLKADRYAADKDGDPKLFGLAPPQLTIVVTLAGGVKKTLLIGNFEGGGNGKRVYARADEKNRTEIVVLSDADTIILLRDRPEYKKLPPYMGLVTESLNGEGVKIEEVTKGGPSEIAGLKSGDIILEVDEKRYDDKDIMLEYVRSKNPGDKVKLKIKREGREFATELVLGKAK
jgi:hypothetical protein